MTFHHETDSETDTIDRPFSRALARVSQADSLPSTSSRRSAPKRHGDTEALVKLLIEARSLFASSRDGDEREHAAAMLLAAEALAGEATPDEVRRAIVDHSRHSVFFPKPGELLAIVRSTRPVVNDDGKMHAGEARTRADNVRLMTAQVKTSVRWDYSNGKPEMWLAGAPGEMRGHSDNGRVIRQMFKRGPVGGCGEWFVNASDARILAGFYTEHDAAYRMEGNVIIAVDKNGVAWTHPDADPRHTP